MFKVTSFALTAYLATTTTYAFLDCSSPLHTDLEHRMCAGLQCSDGQIPIVFDFSEFWRREYINELTIPLPGYEDVVIPIIASGNDKFYTPEGKVRVLDTAIPDDDDDLGTPNQKFGGPGVGLRGAKTNKSYLGKGIMIQESNKIRADDSPLGGVIVFYFDHPKLKDRLTIQKVGLLDFETFEENPEEPHTVIVAKSDLSSTVHKTGVIGYGDNSFQEVQVRGGGLPMDLLALHLYGSGAMVYMQGCVVDPCKIAGNPFALCFNLDESGSIGDSEFDQIKKFSVKLIDELEDQDPLASEYGAVAFADSATLITGLTDPDTAKAKITNYTKTSGGTYITAGLNLCDIELKKAPVGSKKIIVTLTDGYDGGDPCPTAESLDDKGILLVSVGVDYYDENTLKCLASDPTLVFKTADYSGLSAIANEIVDAEVCLDYSKYKL